MPKGNPNIKFYGKETRIKKGEVRSTGRPAKSYKTICERLGIDYRIRLTKREKYELAEALLEMSVEQLTALANDKRIPVFVTTFAKALIDGASAGNRLAVEALFDRFFGKPTQEVITVRKEIEPTSANLKEFTVDELSRMLRRKEVSN